MNYQGAIIEESLEDKLVLRRVKILTTEVEKVTGSHDTPWLYQWTIHTVEVPEDQAEVIAEKIRLSMETEHSSWYADFKNETTHFIIFPKKIFKIDRTKMEEYQSATDYGISLGLPAYQLDFSPDIK